MCRFPLRALLGIALIISVVSGPGCGGDSPTGPKPVPGEAPPVRAFYPGDPAAANNPAVQNQKK